MLFDPACLGVWTVDNVITDAFEQHIGSVQRVCARAKGRHKGGVEGNVEAVGLTSLGRTIPQVQGYHHHG